MDLKRFIKNRLSVVIKKVEPLETLKKIPKKERREVARNPNTPIAALQELARDKNLYVRYEVARNPNTPIAALQELARDADEYVRRSVVHNPNTRG